MRNPYHTPPPPRRAKDGLSEDPLRISSTMQLDSLRPYVGTAPEIQNAPDIPDRGRGIATPSAPSVRRHAALKGFAGGFALAALFAAVAAVLHQGAPKVQKSAATPPLVLDADELIPAEAPSLIERVKNGDVDALAELSKKERTSLEPDEVLALAVGEEIRSGRDAAAFVLELAKQPAPSASDVEKFFVLAGDERTFRAALVAMSECEHAWGPDLLYEATRRFRFQTDVSEFAMALLLTPRVYKYASQALTTVIDAEVTTECKAIRELVSRVEEFGDPRAVRHMAKFAERTGCGASGQEDCYPCLREDRALVSALRAAQGRSLPR